MNSVSEKYLILTYSDLFHINFNGIGCGDGWFNIIDDTCRRLNYDKDDSKVEITQIKEKFGQIRIYLSKYTVKFRDIVEDAQTRSTVVCEWCGSTKDVFLSKTDHVVNLCTICMDVLERDMDLDEGSLNATQLDARIKRYTRIPKS